MSTNAKRRVEIFSAGCPACDETVELVRRVACPSCEVTVLDMNDPAAASRAKQLGVRTAPAVAVEGVLVGGGGDCCSRGGPDEGALRSAGIGRPIP
jgi:glutaredoxin 3